MIFGEILRPGFVNKDNSSCFIRKISFEKGMI